MKKLNDVVDNEVVKYTKFNTLKTKVNNLEKKIPDATTSATELILVKVFATMDSNFKILYVMVVMV